MDIEFHYFMTYLVAARAGFNPDQVHTIAYSCQYIDDNDLIFEMNRDSPEYYSNYVSQTINILKPKRVLLRIYPLFHFIPGDFLCETTRRKDGKLHYLNTTPDSNNARAVIRAALESGDLYRIGLACHSYSDSWSHQNFVGYFDEFNVLRGVFVSLGHVAALGRPDRAAVTWNDRRLLKSQVNRDNKRIYMEAAGRLFEELRNYIYPGIPDEVNQEDREQLVQDLSWAIGENDQFNRRSKARINRYKQLSRKKEYGGIEIKDYDLDQWMDEAVKENIRGFRIRSKKVVARFINGSFSKVMPYFKDKYTWKDPAHYRSTDWYRFQEAVKTQQEKTTEILNEAVFKKLELDMVNW